MADAFDKITSEDLQRHLQRRMFTETERPLSLTENIARTLLPKSLEEGRTEQALAGGLGLFLPEEKPADIASLVGLVATMLAPQVRRLRPGVQALTRVLGPTALAAGTAGVTGTEPMAEAALRTALPLAIPELLFPLGRAGVRFGKQIQFREKMLREGAEDASSLLTAVEKTLPDYDNDLAMRELFANFPQLGKPTRQSMLVYLRDPDVGRAALSNIFKKADKHVVTEFGTQPINMFVRLGTRGGTILSSKPQAMTIQAAQNALKLEKAAARKMPPGAEGKLFRDQTHIIENQYRAELRRVNPILEREYDDAVTQFDKGLDVLDLLGESEAILGSEKGAFLDTEKLARFLLEKGNVERFSPTHLPEVWASVTKGLPPGFADVILKIMGGERAFARVPGVPTGGFAVSLPPVMRKIKPSVVPLPGVLELPSVKRVKGIPLPGQRASEFLSLRGFQEFSEQ